MKKLLMISLILISTSLFAQIDPINKYKRLRIGEKVPEDLLFENMVNYPGGKARFSDFKGKAVILDFWNLHCSPCIGAFPKMQKFQAQFGDRLQILLVNVVNTWEQLGKENFPHNTKSPIIPQIKLPFVLNNRNVTVNDISKGKGPIIELFDHTGEPYHVWIDTNGIVRGNTRGAEVTEESIRYFLANNKMPPTKDEILTPEDLDINEDNIHESILHPRNEYISKSIVYSSIILHGVNTGKGIDAVFVDSTTGKTVGMRSKPRGIMDLYTAASIGALPAVESKRLNSLILGHLVVLDVSNPEAYAKPKDPNQLSAWYTKHYYIYELKLPASKLSAQGDENFIQRNHMMQQDLERFFGIRSYYDKRKVKCWVLTRTSAKDKLSTSGGPHTVGKVTYEGKRVFSNCGLSSFLTYFKSANRWRTPIMPIVNETGFSVDKKIDITLTTNLDDIESLKEDFKKYDLDLIEAERELEVWVISDKQLVKHN